MSGKTPRLFCDECVSRVTSDTLRQAGFDVTTAEGSGLSSASDSAIFARCVSEGRILITEDTDFGNITLFPPEKHHGIVLLRSRRKTMDAIHLTLLKVLANAETLPLEKTLVVVEADGYRLRK